jgi:hypothetical protein
MGGMMSNSVKGVRLMRLAYPAATEVAAQKA